MRLKIVYYLISTASIIFEHAILLRCLCHGHATECQPVPGYGPNPKLVCVCDPSHHTAGDNCEKCAPGFQNRPWKAATLDDANPCMRELSSFNISYSIIRTVRCSFFSCLFAENWPFNLLNNLSVDRNANIGFVRKVVFEFAHSRLNLACDLYCAFLALCFDKKLSGHTVSVFFINILILQRRQSRLD